MENTEINDDILNAVTQTNAQTIGLSPAIAMGNLFHATAQALGLAALNATNAQQQNNIAAQAVTTMGVTTLYSIDTATSAESTAHIFQMLNANQEQTPAVNTSNN